MQSAWLACNLSSPCEVALLKHLPSVLQSLSCLYAVVDHMSLSNPPRAWITLRHLPFPCRLYTGFCFAAMPDVISYSLLSHAWESVHSHIKQQSPCEHPQLEVPQPGCDVSPFCTNETPWWLRGQTQKTQREVPNGLPQSKRKAQGF